MCNMLEDGTIVCYHNTWGSMLKDMFSNFWATLIPIVILFLFIGGFFLVRKKSYGKKYYT